MDLDHSVYDIERLAEYVLLGFEDDEFSLIRKINQNDYPRFNLLVKILNGGDRGHHFSLYVENSPRPHDVMSKGPLIEKEIKRIKESLAKIQD